MEPNQKMKRKPAFLRRLLRGRKKREMNGEGAHHGMVKDNGTVADIPIERRIEGPLEHSSHSIDSNKSHVSDTSGSSERRDSCASNSKILHKSSSQLGLDEYIESRKDEGDFAARMVNIEIPFGKPIEEVYDGVHTGKILGEGFSGVVRRVRHKATGREYAVKCLDLRRIKSMQGLRQLREEIAIMCELDHPSIVRLEEVYESLFEIYLVQELCLGGELFDRLAEQPDEHYTEAECARLVEQMLYAVRYLHSKGIVHRDLKLENFLLSSKSPDANVVLIDFGLSKHFTYGEVHHEPVGSRYTVAPEVLRGSYDERCDIWAIGVLTFLLLSGDAPFGGCYVDEEYSLATLESIVLRGDYSYEREEVWSVVSHRAKAFIEALLVVDPKLRPTAKEAQKHSWLSHREASNDILNPNIPQAMLKFQCTNDIMQLFCEVVSFTLLPGQLEELRIAFKQLDVDGSGELSFDDLKRAFMTRTEAGSLGSLREDDLKGVFNAMRLEKSEARIHWHEFIAAGLSQCQVDDRNLRLAFDRLDSGHKGFITFENVRDLLSKDVLKESEETIKSMWDENLQACNCQREILTYVDFAFLMSEGLESSQSGEHEEPLHSINELHTEVVINGGSSLLPAFKVDVSRRRSRSAGDAEMYREDEEDYSDVPLSVNRALFRTQRQMRQAVIEASCRFQEEKTQRARQHLLTDGKHNTTAGLVLRRGAKAAKRVDSDAALAWLRKTEKEQEAVVRKATKNSGRRKGGHVNYSDIGGQGPTPSTTCTHHTS